LSSKSEEEMPQPVEDKKKKGKKGKNDPDMEELKTNMDQLSVEGEEGGGKKSNKKGMVSHFALSH
jgi:hypothetical protein